MSSEKNIVWIRHKFATLRNQTIHIDINGFQLKTTIDKVDELFEYNVIRYCVNYVLYQLDRARQDAIDYNMIEQMGFPCKFNNVANIPADMSGHAEPQKVSIIILVDDVGQSIIDGKGKYSIPFLQNNNYNIVIHDYQVLMEKNNILV